MHQPQPLARQRRSQSVAPFASRTDPAHVSAAFRRVAWPSSAVRGCVLSGFETLKDVIVGKGWVDGGCPLALARSAVQAGCYPDASVHRRSIDRRMAQLRETGLITVQRVKTAKGRIEVRVDLDEPTWAANYGRDRHRRYFEGCDQKRIAGQQERRERKRERAKAAGTYRGPGRPKRMPGLASLAAPMEALAAGLDMPVAGLGARVWSMPDGQTCPSTFSGDALESLSGPVCDILETMKPPVPQVLEEKKPRDPPTPRARVEPPRIASALPAEDVGLCAPKKSERRGEEVETPDYGKPGYEMPPADAVLRGKLAISVHGTGQYPFVAPHHRYGTKDPFEFLGRRFLQAVKARAGSWKELCMLPPAKVEETLEDIAIEWGQRHISSPPVRRPRPDGPQTGGGRVASKDDIRRMAGAKLGGSITVPINQMTGLQRTHEQVAFALEKTAKLLRGGKLRDRQAAGSYALKMLQGMTP